MFEVAVPEPCGVDELSVGASEPGGGDRYYKKFNSSDPEPGGDCSKQTKHKRICGSDNSYTQGYFFISQDLLKYVSKLNFTSRYSPGKIVYMWSNRTFTKELSTRITFLNSISLQPDVVFHVMNSDKTLEI